MKRAQKKRAEGPRSSLWFVALLLAGSAVVRATDHSDALVAFAQDSTAMMSESTEPDTDPAMAGQTEDPIDLAEILADLTKREEKIEMREAMIAERMAALSLAETEVARNLAALEQAEERLRATLALSATAAEDDLTRLTSVYENMKPKEAADLFEEMSPEFAAGFLARMRPDAAAAVMAGLEPATAYSVSVIMAGRNANAPTE